MTPPNALLVQVSPGSGNVDLELVKTFDGVQRHLRCELDMKLPAVPPNDGEIDYIYFATGGTAESSPPILYFAHFNTGWVVAQFDKLGDGGTLDMTAPASAPPIGRWFHVTFTTDGTSVSVAYDGVPAGTLSGIATFAGTKTSIDVGVPYADSQMAHVVEYDDVACHVAP